MKLKYVTAVYPSFHQDTGQKTTEYENMQIFVSWLPECSETANMRMRRDFIKKMLKSGVISMKKVTGKNLYASKT